MKRKGFTLIELLSVIVILAIIALIAVPTVMNVINKAQKSAFKDGAYGIMKAGELYYTNHIIDIEEPEAIKTFTFPNDLEGLEIKGSKPTGGIMSVTKDGKVGLAVNNGRYCVKKGYNDEDVTIDENINNCTIPTILVSENSCIHDLTTVCENGTAVRVQVNETLVDFYVIKDTKEELTLITARNLGGICCLGFKRRLYRSWWN